MAVLAGFFTLSIVSSVFVVMACALSSRISQKEGLSESYADFEADRAIAPVSSRSY